MATATIKMSLHLSPQTNDLLEDMCEDEGLSKTALIRKSLALMKLAIDSKKKGNHFAILDYNNVQVSEIVGL
mgnify:CR=1 FL=1